MSETIPITNSEAPVWFYHNTEQTSTVSIDMLRRHSHDYLATAVQLQLPPWAAWFAGKFLRQPIVQKKAPPVFWTNGMRSWETLDKLPITLELLDYDSPPNLPATLAAHDPHQTIWEAFRSLQNLHQHPAFWRRLIVMAVVEFLLFVSFLGAPFLLSIHRGWRLEFIRLEDPTELPSVRPMQWVKYGWDGTLLWLANLLYAIPAMIYAFFSNQGWIFDLWIVIKWGAGLLLPGYESQIGIVELVTIVLEYLVTSGVLLLYAIAVWPVFRIGMLYYAKSGDYRDLFNIPKNIHRVSQQFPNCMHVYYQDRIIWLIIGPLTAILSPFTFGLSSIYGEVLRMYLTGRVYKADYNDVVEPTDFQSNGGKDNLIESDD